MKLNRKTVEAFLPVINDPAFTEAWKLFMEEWNIMVLSIYRNNPDHGYGRGVDACAQILSCLPDDIRAEADYLRENRNA
jgi:hypothetical protein